MIVEIKAAKNASSYSMTNNRKVGSSYEIIFSCVNHTFMCRPMPIRCKIIKKNLYVQRPAINLMEKKQPQLYSTAILLTKLSGGIRVDFKKTKNVYRLSFLATSMIADFVDYLTKMVSII